MKTVALQISTAVLALLVTLPALGQETREQSRSNSTRDSTSKDVRKNLEFSGEYNAAVGIYELFRMSERFRGDYPPLVRVFQGCKLLTREDPYAPYYNTFRHEIYWYPTVGQGLRTAPQRELPYRPVPVSGLDPSFTRFVECYVAYGVLGAEIGKEMHRLIAGAGDQPGPMVVSSQEEASQLIIVAAQNVLKREELIPQIKEMAASLKSCMIPTTKTMYDSATFTVRCGALEIEPMHRSATWGGVPFVSSQQVWQTNTTVHIASSRGSSKQQERSTGTDSSTRATGTTSGAKSKYFE